MQTSRMHAHHPSIEIKLIEYRYMRNHKTMSLSVIARQLAAPAFIAFNSIALSAPDIAYRAFGCSVANFSIRSGLPLATVSSTLGHRW